RPQYGDCQHQRRQQPAQGPAPPGWFRWQRTIAIHGIGDQTGARIGNDSISQQWNGTIWIEVRLRAHKGLCVSETRVWQGEWNQERYESKQSLGDTTGRGWPLHCLFRKI